MWQDLTPETCHHKLRTIFQAPNHRTRIHPDTRSYPEANQSGVRVFAENRSGQRHINPDLQYKFRLLQSQ